jgi:acetoin utilization protein AcuB
MTKKPYTVEPSASLATAHAMMRAHDVRHLPVVDPTGNLCGIVSQRDLHLLETLKDIDPEAIQVEEAMVARPFVVTADMPLDEVVEIMGEHKYGSVVVSGREGVEGIFTATDACRALAEVLRRVTG